MSSRERMQKALDSLLYLPHLQAQHSDDQRLPVGGAAPGAAAAGKGRPWDRGDLFRRLATFRSSTWFCKPVAISPVECARRGWTNTAADLLTCEFCKAKLSCAIPADLLPQQAQQAAERHAAKLGDAHDGACPWRTATSSLSLLQFPPLSADAVRRDFDARCALLQRLACLPPVASEPYQALAAACTKHRLDLLLLQGPAGAAASAAAASAAATAPEDAVASVSEATAVLGTPQFEARARLLALCGWDLKLMTTAAPSDAIATENGSAGQQQQQDLPALVGPESAALLCSLCNAKAGLWTFFPQCKPLVLAGPRRRRASAPAQATRAAVSRSAVSWNVAADIGTTIAGGMMGPAAGSPGPFGAGTQQQPAAFGMPGSAPGAALAAPAAADATTVAGEEGPAMGHAPFGSGSQGGSVPVFGFAALQASSPAPAAAAVVVSPRRSGAEVGAAKRKQPDFSWDAVMADIDAQAAAQKRSKGTPAAGGSGFAGGLAASVDTASAGPGAAARPGSEQQVAAAAAMAGRYKGVAVSPMDPLALHRPFCPWINCTQVGEKEGRCGWRWCLQQLAASPAAGMGTVADDALAAANGGDGDDGERKGWDPAKLLRSVLQHVGDVRK
ncbi:hypothetical protein D9Q98_006598 [Chlorella vulgaris]|uniref:C3HC-type domain-containing protein n=1 Tax=Chlorella vulgaris TaxID=3077 RepID=A0A9D4YV85_CHLVU|nr:hypothetical protein D9Q98_006598 [Chlorella vulgaris]